MIETEALRVGYAERQISEFGSHALAAGVHLIIGANGIGKTTLLRTLAGVIPPVAGSVAIDGQDPMLVPSAKASVGNMPHRAALAPNLSVHDNLVYFGLIHGIARARVDHCVDEVLAIVKIRELADRKAKLLSRGQTSRVSFARSLLGEPNTLLLDEPFAGLDAEAAEDVRRQLRWLAAAGRVVLVSTHDLGDLSNFGDDAIVLSADRAAEVISLPELRREQLGGTYEVRMRGSADLYEALRQLGRPASRDDDGGIRIRVTSEQDLQRAVAELVTQGVGVSEVAPTRNVLEDLFQHAVGRDGRSRDAE